MKHTSYEDVKVKKSELIFSEKGKAEYIYIVAEGEVITVKESGGRLYPTGLHRAGDFIGTGSIVNDKYFENAFARVDSVLVPLPVTDIGSVIRKCPGWITSLMRTIITRLEGSVNLLAEQRILEDLSEYDEVYTPEEESIYRRKLTEL